MDLISGNYTNIIYLPDVNYDITKGANDHSEIWFLGDKIAQINKYKVITSSSNPTLQKTVLLPMQYMILLIRK